MHYFEKKKRNTISKFDHRKFARSMSSTNVGKNCYCSISLVLTLEQNILITITSQQPLVFILSPSLQLISADALHIFSLRFEMLFITHRFNWALLDLLRFKRRDTRQNVFSFTFVSSYNTGLLFAKIFSMNWQLKTLLDFCLRLQAGIGLFTSRYIYPLPGYY